MKTMIQIILDRSGSMGGRESDVVNGVNSFIEEQKKLPDPASIALTRFDSEEVDRFRPMQALSELKLLRHDEYSPRGGTPLLDAVGRSIKQLDEDWKREQPERCIVVVVTDGQENASKEYKKSQIQAMVKARQDSGLWAFIYLGANVDAFAEAGTMGFARGNTAGYNVASSAGVMHAYDTLSASVGHMRASGQSVAHNLGRNLGESEEDDLQLPQPSVAPAAPSPIVPPAAWNPPADGSDVWSPPS